MHMGFPLTPRSMTSDDLELLSNFMGFSRDYLILGGNNG